MARAMTDLQASLHWRYAVKKFDSVGRLTPDAVTSLKEALRLSPSSFGLQPYRAIFIDAAGLRMRLRAAAYDQPQVSEASHLVVFAIETIIDEAYVQRHFTMLARFIGMPLEGSLAQHRDSVMRSVLRMTSAEKRSWASRQAFLALGFLLFAAAQLRIDASPMEGFVSARYDEILGLSKQGLSSVVIAALGYRSPEDRFQHLKKFRRPAQELFGSAPSEQPAPGSSHEARRSR